MIPIYFTMPSKFTKRFLLREVFQDKFISVRIETTVRDLID